MSRQNKLEEYVFNYAQVLVTQLSPTLCKAMDCSPPGYLSMGLPRQEYWSELPVPSPGDLSNPGIEPRSPTLQADSLLPEPPKKSLFLIIVACYITMVKPIVLSLIF